MAIVPKIQRGLRTEKDKGRKIFIKKFGHRPRYKISIPSRVNLIGEHIDYFEGVVLPMAIENVKMISYLSPRKDNKIKMYSVNLPKDKKPFIEILTLDDRVKDQWVQYVQGAIAMFAEEYSRKKLKGFNIVIDSSIPIGSGLSSSSVLTMTALAALGIVNGFTDGKNKYPRARSIKLINQKDDDEISHNLLGKLCMMGCWAEYWYGTRGGAMDHFVVTVSKKGFATQIDTRGHNYKYNKMPPELAIIICNTMVRHNQLFSEFGIRKETAFLGYNKLLKYYPRIKNVRDITLIDLNKHKSVLSKKEYKRLLHPITEIVRVKEFEKALNNKDFVQLGKIVNRAFLSLKDSYEVSCDELNIMQRAAINSPGCFGARITGGGFGGCIVAFVDKNKKMPFIESVKKKYDNNPKIKKQKIDSEIWEARSGEGLRITDA